MTRTTLGAQQAGAMSPHQLIIVRDPRMGLEAMVVVDNVACGPVIGRVHRATDVTLEKWHCLAQERDATKYCRG
jgi:hypothetical protein